MSFEIDLLHYTTRPRPVPITGLEKNSGDRNQKWNERVREIYVKTRGLRSEFILNVNSGCNLQTVFN